MRDFAYAAPATLEEAIRAGAKTTSRFIAGGTLLVDLLRLDVEQPELLIDLNPSLSPKLEWKSDALWIGAGVKNSDLADDRGVQTEFTALSQALLSGASPQVRNMASVGGNLMQRTRCSYFRDISVGQCNKRTPGSGCAALRGHSRNHAVLGTSEHCIATHPSDMAVALLALEAMVHTLGPRGGRVITLSDLHTVPGTTPTIETILEPGEVITSVMVPRRPNAKSAYVKVRDRAAFAFALASAAAVLEVDAQSIRRARVALGGVATKPWRATEVEAALHGQPLTASVLDAAAKLAARGAVSTTDNAFKVQLAEKVVARALKVAGGLT